MKIKQIKFKFQPDGNKYTISRNSTIDKNNNNILFLNSFIIFLCLLLFLPIGGFLEIILFTPDGSLYFFVLFSKLFKK